MLRIRGVPVALSYMRLPLFFTVLVLVVFAFGVPSQVMAITAAESAAIAQQKNEAQRRLDSAIAEQKNLADTTESGSPANQGAQDALKELMKQLQQMIAPLLDANYQCMPVLFQCGCGQVKGSNGCTAGSNKWMCECDQSIPDTNHTVKGICVAPLKCEGQSFTNLQGQSTGVGDTGNIIGGIFKGLLDSLMQGLSAGGGGGGGGGGTPYGTTGCTQYYTVTTPSTDPCATYLPPVSGDILGSFGSGSSDLLLDALGTGSQSSAGTNSQTSVSSQLSQGQADGTVPTVSTQSSQVPPGLGQQTVGLSGTRGDIQITSTGGTIFAGARDEKTGTEVAGFFGGDTLGATQPQGVVVRLCQTRPWANSFISYVIPSTFFDGLCSWRGYQVGIPAPLPESTAIVQQTPPTAPAATTTPVYSGIEPKADIWAVPMNVPLGARTSIFWNTQGVSSCTVTSPDGNFFENALFGGAATVPLTGVTVYTISCLVSDGSHVTDFVTVNLSI